MNAVGTAAHFVVRCGEVRTGLNRNGLVQCQKPEPVDPCDVVVAFEGLAVGVKQHVVEHAARLEDVV